jgi:hypothetical protein
MWIELHDSARDHPKLLKLARDLGIAKVQALGHVCSLWLWVLRMAPDGDLSSFDGDDIEIGAEWDGQPGKFVSALISRRFIDKTDDGYVVHDWQDYSGSLKSAERMRKSRAAKRDRERDDALRNSSEQLRTVASRYAERPERPDRPDQNDRANVTAAPSVTRLTPEPPPSPPSGSLPQPKHPGGYRTTDLSAIAWGRGWRGAKELKPAQIVQADQQCSGRPWTVEEMRWAVDATELDDNPNLGLLLFKLHDVRKVKSPPKVKPTKKPAVLSDNPDVIAVYDAVNDALDDSMIVPEEAERILKAGFTADIVKKTLEPSWRKIRTVQEVWLALNGGRNAATATQPRC